MSDIQQRKCQIIEKYSELYIKCDKYMLNISELLKYIGKVVRTKYEVLVECNEFCKENPVRCWYSLIGEAIGILFNFIQFLFMAAESNLGELMRSSDDVRWEVRTLVENSYDLSSGLGDRIWALLKLFMGRKLNVLDKTYVEEFVEKDKSFKKCNR